jgi:hypothetical protein
MLRQDLLDLYEVWVLLLSRLGSDLRRFQQLLDSIISPKEQQPKPQEFLLWNKPKEVKEGAGPNQRPSPPRNGQPYGA